MSDEETEGAEGEFSWSGELVDGWIPYGLGKATYSNGDSFEGAYDDSKRNGKGKYIYANGAEYEGNYSQNQKTGYGVMKYPDKSIYEGAWFRDMKHGEGKYTYPNQDIYKGEWKNNIRHGTGTYFFSMSMSQVANQIAENLKPDVSNVCLYQVLRALVQRHSEHLLVDNKWMVTFGSHQALPKHMDHGLNKHVWTRNLFKILRGDSMCMAKFEGEYLRSIIYLHHKKYFFHNDATVFIGTWCDGSYVVGQWVFRNGDVYEGSFKKNKPEGKGKFMFAANKTTIFGKFADTRWTQGGWMRTPEKVLEPKEAVRKLPPPLVFNPIMDRSTQPCFVTPMRFT